jgi:hypothetical protein
MKKITALPIAITIAFAGCNNKDIYKNPELGIRPPFAFDIPLASHIINTEKDTTLLLETGTQIFIPQKSFKYKDGSQVNGSVDIKFRELDNMRDIFVSGIPLSVISGDKTYGLSTMGMFEIRGYQHGQEIFIDSSKYVDVTIPVSDKGALYNSYFFNEKEGTWEVFDSSEIVLQATEELKKEFVVPTPPKGKPDNENRVIKITPDNPKSFPELADFANVKFYVVDTCLFNPSDAANDWTAITIEKIDGFDLLFSLHFSGKDADRASITKNYTVEPVYEGKDYEKAKRDYEKRYNNYLGRVDKYKRLKAERHVRVNKWNDSIKRREKAIIERRIMDSLYIARYQDANIREQEQQQIESLFNDELTNKLTENSGYKNGYRFRLNRLGIYNIDRLNEMASLKAFSPRQYYSNGTLLYPDLLFLIGLKNKSMGRFEADRKFVYNSKDTYLLWGITLDKRFFYADTLSFAKELRRSDNAFEVIVVPKPFESLEDLKTFIKDSISVK